MKAYAMSLMMTMTIFYAIAIITCFLAYREFKGMLYDNGMGGAAG